MNVNLFFLFLLFTLFPLQASTQLYSEITSLSKCLGSSTVYQGFCQVQGTYKAELDRVPGPWGSYRSGGQYKVTRVECDKCCHWVFRMFRMSGPFLVCCVTQVCLAFIPNHPFPETLFHAFRFQYMCFCCPTHSLTVAPFHAPHGSWCLCSSLLSLKVI